MHELVKSDIKYFTRGINNHVRVSIREKETYVKNDYQGKRG